MAEEDGVGILHKVDLSAFDLILLFSNSKLNSKRHSFSLFPGRCIHVTYRKPCLCITKYNDNCKWTKRKHAYIVGQPWEHIILLKVNHKIHDSSVGEE